jgi:hypothetical protein
LKLLIAAVRPTIRAEEQAAADERLERARQEFAEHMAAERAALAKRKRPWARLLARRGSVRKD